MLAAAFGSRSRRLGRRSVLPLGAVLAFLLLPAALCDASGARIFVDGKAIELTTSVGTVADALELARVTLGPDDEVKPALETELSAAPVIRVSRVTFSEATAEIKVPYKTQVRAATSARKPYHPTVIQEGRAGLKRVTYRARLVDGVEQSRQNLQEELVREPIAQVVVSRKPQFLGSRGVYTGKRLLTVVATAYDPGPGSCGKYANGKTCNGKRAGYGIIAVDPKQIPLGAKLYVPGYGYGIAADVGSAIKGNRIDLGYNSRAGAIAWGKKTVKLTIVE